MSLLESFSRYYETPNPDAISELWNEINNWDASDLSGFHEAILPLWKSAPICKESMSVIESNGSTRPTSSLHPFGPYHGIWHHLSEGIDLDTPILYLLSPFPRMNIFRDRLQAAKGIWTINKTPYPKFLNFPIDVLHPEIYRILFHTIKNISEHYGQPVKIESYQSILLRFFHDPVFVDLLKQHLEYIWGFQNTFWDPLFDAPKIRSIVPVNDYMIDWSRGVRFYTCTHGKRHFLPTFIPFEDGTIDLLNLSDKRKKSFEDLISIDTGHGQMCECGKTFYPHCFVPHIEFAIRSPNKEVVYDCSIAEGLETPLSSLQFIQNERNVVEVCYIVGNGEERMSQSDKERIGTFFDRKGLNVKWSFNRYLLLGRRFKLVSFWKNKLDYPISEFKPFVPHHWDEKVNLLDVPDVFYSDSNPGFRVVQEGFMPLSSEFNDL